jgi:hypothetical protein
MHATTTKTYRVIVENRHPTIQKQDLLIREHGYIAQKIINAPKIYNTKCNLDAAMLGVNDAKNFHPRFFIMKPLHVTVYDEFEGDEFTFEIYGTCARGKWTWIPDFY